MIPSSLTFVGLQSGLVLVLTQQVLRCLAVYQIIVQIWLTCVISQTSKTLLHAALGLCWA